MTHCMKNRNARKHTSLVSLFKVTFSYLFKVNSTYWMAVTLPLVLNHPESLKKRKH